MKTRVINRKGHILDWVYVAQTKGLLWGWNEWDTYCSEEDAEAEALRLSRGELHDVVAEYEDGALICKVP